MQPGNVPTREYYPGYIPILYRGPPYTVPVLPWDPHTRVWTGTRNVQLVIHRFTDSRFPIPGSRFRNYYSGIILLRDPSLPPGQRIRGLLPTSEAVLATARTLEGSFNDPDCAVAQEGHCWSGLEAAITLGASRSSTGDYL